MAKKVLIVDDEPDLLRVVTFRIKKMGYDVLVASDGEEALDKAGKEKPDLLLLDIRLPKLSGPEVCRKIRADKRLKDIPVILFTASTAQLQDKVKEAGASDWLVKPFDLCLLEEKIKKFIG